MGFKRVDEFYIEDEAGNRAFLPDLTHIEMPVDDLRPEIEMPPAYRRPSAQYITPREAELERDVEMPGDNRGWRRSERNPGVTADYITPDQAERERDVEMPFDETQMPLDYSPAERRYARRAVPLDRPSSMSVAFEGGSQRNPGMTATPIEQDAYQPGPGDAVYDDAELTGREASADDSPEASALAAYAASQGSHDDELSGRERSADDRSLPSGNLGEMDPDYVGQDAQARTAQDLANRQGGTFEYDQTTDQTTPASPAEQASRTLAVIQNIGKPGTPGIIAAAYPSMDPGGPTGSPAAQLSSDDYARQAENRARLAAGLTPVAAPGAGPGAVTAPAVVPGAAVIGAVASGAAPSAPRGPGGGGGSGTPSSQPFAMSGDPRNTAEGVAGENAAMGNVAAQKRAAAEADIKSQADLAQRGADLEVSVNTARMNDEVLRKQDEKVAETKRVREEADFLTRQDALARTKVDPSAYFSDRSAFSKVAWIVGLVSGAIGSGGDASKNVALKMLSDAIDQDMKHQSESIARRTAAMDKQGTRMESRWGREADARKDDAEGRFQRLQGIRNHLVALSKVPGGEQRTAAYSMIDAEMAGLQLQTSQKRTDHARARDAAEIARRAAERAAATARAHSAAQARLAREQKLADDTRERGYRVEDRDFKAAEDRANAMVTISEGKAGSVSANGASPGGVPGKDFLALPLPDAGRGIGGFFTKLADGTVEEVRIAPSERAVLMEAQAQLDLSAKLVDVGKALSTADWSSRYLKDDPEFNAAINSLVRPWAKNQDPASKVTDADAADAARSAFGVDYNSLKSMVFSDPKAVEALVAKRVAQQQEAAAVMLRTRRGYSLPKGATIGYAPGTNMVLGDTPKAPTAADQKARAGVSQNPATPLKTAAEYGARVKHAKENDIPLDQVLAHVEPEVQAIIQQAEDGFKKFPGKADEVRANAIKALDAYGSKARGSQKSGGFAASDAQGAAMTEARLRIDAFQAMNKGRLDALVKSVPLTADPAIYLREQAAKRGIVLEEAEIQALAKQANNMTNRRLF